MSLCQNVYCCVQYVSQIEWLNERSTDGLNCNWRGIKRKRNLHHFRHCYRKELEENHWSSRGNWLKRGELISIQQLNHESESSHGNYWGCRLFYLFVWLPVDYDEDFLVIRLIFMSEVDSIDIGFINRKWNYKSDKVPREQISFWSWR